MKNIPSFRFTLRNGAMLLASLILLSILTGCESISSYSVQSYQGPAPITDNQMLKMAR